MITHRQRNKLIHNLFCLGVIGKAVDGVFEVIGGFILFFVNPNQVSWLLWALTAHELSKDPQDLIANLILHSAQHLSPGTKVFAAVFLLWHGAIKIGLVLALWRKQLWAYPTAIAIFVLFVMYQFYRYSHTHSVWLLALSVLDIFVIILTWLEYKRLRRSNKGGETRE